MSTLNMLNQLIIATLCWKLINLVDWKWSRLWIMDFQTRCLWFFFYFSCASFSINLTLQFTL